MNKKTEMESKAKRGELTCIGVSRNAVFDKEGKLFLDMD